MFSKSSYSFGKEKNLCRKIVDYLLKITPVISAPLGGNDPL